MMDKMVYCIIFPTLAVGVLFRDGMGSPKDSYHVILALCLCVTLLVRDHYVNFLRTIADRHNGDSSVQWIGKIRTLWALPTSCIMYAYCFNRAGYEDFFYFNSILRVFQEESMWIVLIIVELLLFVINIVSAISYTRTYGPYLLDEICEGDDKMRKRILQIFPNMLTLMNAIMGVMAMVLAWNERYHLSFVLILLAAIFDKLDGAAARKLGLTEEEAKPGEKKLTPGMIFDDIADFISFCLAPAVIAHSYVRSNDYVEYIYVYTLLGLFRLIYFTIDKNPIRGYFKGLPSPASAIMVCGMVHVADRFDPTGNYCSVIVLALYALAAIAMNTYFIKFIHFGKLMNDNKMVSQGISIIICVSIFLKDYLGIIALVIMALYVTSPLYIKPPEAEEIPEG
jgi:CDP-diacylglycerol---serine O-phosphatidyltransferase